MNTTGHFVHATIGKDFISTIPKTWCVSYECSNFVSILAPVAAWDMSGEIMVAQDYFATC